MKKKIKKDFFSYSYDKTSKVLVCTNETICLTNVEEDNLQNAIHYVYDLFSNYGVIYSDYESLEQFYEDLH